MRFPQEAVGKEVGRLQTIGNAGRSYTPIKPVLDV